MRAIVTVLLFQALLGLHGTEDSLFHPFEGF